MKKLAPALISLALVPFVLAAAGCGRTATDTVVADDGSWTRTVKLYLPKEGQMGSKPPTFEESFVLPSGEGWKITRTEEKDNRIFTAVRSAKLGETVARDVQIKQKDKVVCMNEVRVSEIAPGRYEYVETVRYIGADRPDMAKPVKEIAPVLKEVLPAGTDDATVKRIGGKFFVAAWQVIFGPSDPILSMLLFSPDLAERRMKAKFGRAMDSILLAEFGDRMDKDGRRQVIRNLIAKMDAQEMLEGKKAKEEESGGDGQLIAMFSTVKLPGTIVESNGEMDEVTGEVFWAYYPESAQVGDVVLRAVCEVKR